MHQAGVGLAQASSRSGPQRTCSVALARETYGRADVCSVDPAIRGKLLEAAQDPVGGTAEAFGQRVREDFEKYGRLVKALDIKIK